LFTISNSGWITGRILLGYFLLASNIAVEKWLLESYNLYEINFTTAALFMILTALQELLKRGVASKDQTCFLEDPASDQSVYTGRLALLP